ASASSDQNQSGNQSNRNNNTGVATRPSHRGMRRRDPFSVFNDMEMMMDRMLGGRLPLLRAFPNAQGADGGWARRVDIYEQDNNLIVNAELPGVKRDDLNVTLDQGDLVIQGERKSEHEDNDNQNYYRMERTYGSFYRRIPMPDGVKEDNISASFDDG